MRRYLLAIHDGKSGQHDEGVSCATFDDAKREAVKTVGALLKDQTADWSGETWRMEVRDDSGELVAALVVNAYSARL